VDFGLPNGWRAPIFAILGNHDEDTEESEDTLGKGKIIAAGGFDGTIVAKGDGDLCRLWPALHCQPGPARTDSAWAST
jgi:hypothetical protein